MKRTPGNFITFNCETNVVDHITTRFCTTRRIRDICTRNYQKSQTAHKYYRVSHSLTHTAKEKGEKTSVQCSMPNQNKNKASNKRYWKKHRKKKQNKYEWFKLSAEFGVISQIKQRLLCSDSPIPLTRPLISGCTCLFLGSICTWLSLAGIKKRSASANK